MITGIHAIICTKHSAEMYAFLKDVLDLRYVDAGNGMCDDIAAAVRQLEAKGIATTPVADRGWGLVTMLKLSGGEELGLYEPRHLSPLA
jgi:hypothetical protein